MTTARKKIETWEGIAAYLNVSLRTAQRWRKQFQMPVHREAGGRSDRVFVWADELDAWRYRSPAATEDRLVEAEVPSAEAAAAPRWRNRWIWLGAAALAVLAVALPLCLAPDPDGRLFVSVTDYDTGSRIDFLDGRSQVVHSIDVPENQYKQRIEKYQQEGRKILVVRDVNGDGYDDIVFAPRERRNHLEFHFWKGGRSFTRQSWNLALEYSHQGKSYGDFSIGSIEVADLDGRGAPEIAVVQRTHFAPSCLRVFDTVRNSLLTVWHPGGLNQCRVGGFETIQPRGIVVGGTNNCLSEGSAPIFFSLATDWCKRGQTLDLITDDCALPASVPPGIRLVYVNLQADDALPDQAIWESPVIRRFPEGPAENMIVGASHREFFFNTRLECVFASVNPQFALEHRLDLARPDIQALLRPTYWNGRSWQSSVCAIP